MHKLQWFRCLFVTERPAMLKVSEFWKFYDFKGLTKNYDQSPCAG